MANKSIKEDGDNMVNVEEILAEVLQKIKPLDTAGKRRVLDAISVFYSLGPTSTPPNEVTPTPTIISRANSFSERAEVSPKEFLREKSPRSDIEKVVCLAYFLTHYRESPHFKTIDISKLNTEAAQLKFSNAAYAVDNAGKRGFLVPAGKNGMKQISSMGEQFVNALPNREDAKSAIEQFRLRKPIKKNAQPKKGKSSNPKDSEETEN